MIQPSKGARARADVSRRTG